MEKKRRRPQPIATAETVSTRLPLGVAASLGQPGGVSAPSVAPAPATDDPNRLPQVDPTVLGRVL